MLPTILRWTRDRLRYEGKAADTGTKGNVMVRVVAGLTVIISLWMVPAASGAQDAKAMAQDVLSFGRGKPVPSGNVSAGQNIFNAVCWACHDRDLSGYKGPPLTGPTFYKIWQGRSAKELSDYIQNRMPIDDPGALSEQGARNVVAYIVAYTNRPESLRGSGK